METASTSSNEYIDTSEDFRVHVGVELRKLIDETPEEKQEKQEEEQRKKREAEEKIEAEYLNRPFRSRGERKVLERTFRPLRKLVSQNRRRFTEDGYDLDLTYITDRIIAMGYPSGGYEWFYRNPMASTVAFLEKRHKDHYMVFNLRGYYNYDIRNFDNRVLYFEMNDHHPPRLEQIARICRRAHEYLMEDPRNVIAFHCKAGKGRTGVMICAYLVYINFYPSPRQILDYYGIIRTVNNKGVTIPSQRRYVYYYSQLRCNHLNYMPLRLKLKGLYVEHPPVKKSNYKRYSYFIQVFIGDILVFSGKPFAFNADDETAVWMDSSPIGNDTYDPTNPRAGCDVISRRCYGWTISKEQDIFLEGDIRINLMRKKVFVTERVDIRKNKVKEVGHVWFNTMFSCPSFCGGIYAHGDRMLPYPEGGTTLVSQLSLEETSESELEKSGSKRVRKGVTRKEKVRIEDIIVPPGLAQHAPAETIDQVYKAQKIRPPREDIMKLLVEAHKRGLVKDAYNERRQSKLRFEPIEKAREGRPNGDGPWSVKRNRSEHVLAFDRLEIDRACKNEKIDVSMKLFVVLSCVDEQAQETSEAARKYLLDVTQKQQKFNEKRRQKLVYDDYVERQGSFARRPNYGIDEFGNEVLTGNVVSSQPYRGDIRLIDYELRRKYFGRQRLESDSVYPPVHHNCPLLLDPTDIPSTSAGSAVGLAKLVAD